MDMLSRGTIRNTHRLFVNEHWPISCAGRTDVRGVLLRIVVDDAIAGDDRRCAAH